MITGKPYEYLKFLAQVLLPALGALYFGLAGIWGLPSAEEVVGTIVVVDTFLGVLLQVSSTVYNKNEVATGDLKVVETPEGQKFTLELDESPEDLAEKDKVVFKVDGP